MRTTAGFFARSVKLLLKTGSLGLCLIITLFLSVAGDEARDRCPLEDASSVAVLNANWNIMRAQGNSMEPLIRHGDVIIVSGFSFEDLKPGMIALFSDDSGEFVLHRVELEEAMFFRTRGLRNRRLDPGELSPTNLKGVLVAVLRRAPGMCAASDCASLLAIAHCKSEDDR